MTDSTYSLPVMETVKTAWAKVNGAKGTFWAVIGIFFLLQLIIGMLSGIGMKWLFSLIGVLAQIVYLASLFYLCIRRAQDVPITYKMIKDMVNVRIILCFIGVYLLQLLLFIPAGLVIGAGVLFYQSPAMVMHLIGFLCYVLAIIFFIWIGVRVSLALGAVVDKNLSPIAAFKFSFKATQGNVLNMLGIVIVNFVIMLGCAITLGIGLIWGIPWVLIIFGEIYKRLSSRQDVALSA